MFFIIHSFRFFHSKDDALQTFNMVRTNNRIEAALFIVKDPTSLPERVQWAAALVGGWVTEPSGLVNNDGVVLKYKRAIRTQKKIFLTEGFRNGHLEISALIVDSINFHKPKNGWRITQDASKAHFVLDRSENAVNGDQKTYSKSSFLSRILTLDMDHSGRCANSN